MYFVQSLFAEIGGSIGILLGFSIYGTVTSLFAKKPADEKNNPADEEIQTAVEAVKKRVSHSMALNIAMAKTSATLREEIKNLDLRMDSMAKAIATLRE